MRTKIKIIIDTNLWISFLLTKKYDFIDVLLLKQKITLVFSEELMEEFVDVARRPKLKSFFLFSELEDLLQLIALHAEYCLVHSTVNACRDDKDNFLLALAKDSQADYLITGDKDLLVLEKFGNTRIITMSEFQTLWNSKSTSNLLK